ncbi:MAG: imidazoleglycerol-phosphate dehydratase HisB [Candidatus Dormiibacterota bacterium]
MERRGSCLRETRETRVEVDLRLDGAGTSRVATGVGFLDHMLESLATHAGFDLDVTARGDLQVDAHHTVEDVALCLGRALTRAVAEGPGVERFGHAVVPMDESLGWAAVDFSGRALAVIDLGFVGPTVGGIPGSLLEHFFESMVRSAEITLHLSAQGRDDHHLAEAAFKALARALRQAVQVDPRGLRRAASTKEPA